LPSLAVSGQPLHTRSLTLVLSTREDGRLRVHGDVIDLRKCGVVPMVDGAQTAGIIHHMSLTAVVEPVRRELLSLDAAQPVVAVEACERTAGESCRDPVHRLQELVGSRFDAALPARLAQVFGGPRGCSHLLTLFHLMASAVPRALDLEERLAQRRRFRRGAGERLFRRSVFVDGHEPEQGALQLAVQLTDFHAAPLALVEDRLDHFLLHSELRALAQTGLGDLGLGELRAWRRERSRETLDSPDWWACDAELAGLAGRPVVPGLGSELRRRFAGCPGDAPLLDALLQLAPGFVQCTPALTDRLLSSLGGSGRFEGELPGFLGVGGAVDSCYMWRGDGPLARLRPGHEPRR
jgi:hypothetical protein